MRAGSVAARWLIDEVASPDSSHLTVRAAECVTLAAHHRELTGPVGREVKNSKGVGGTFRSLSQA